MDLSSITAGDFLAGGGGVTEAMTKLGLDVKWVLNHDPLAIKVNSLNHPKIRHYWADMYDMDERSLDSVMFAWASIECTQHSNALGGRKRKIGSYMLGWEFIRYFDHMRPYVIGIENVPEFLKWSPVDEQGDPIKDREGEEFERWKNTICKLGYDFHYKIINAADYGLPTRRDRLFIFFTREDLDMKCPWPEPTHNRDGSNGLKKWEACGPYINLKDEGESIFGREFNERLPKQHRKMPVPNSLKRIAGGIKKHYPDLYFILQYYGTGINTNSIDAPLNTITVKDRHQLVTIQKKLFIQDHCHTDQYQDVDSPLSPQLTRQTKQIVSAHFIAHQQNSNKNPEYNTQKLEDPLWSITTKEKQQFIAAYFTSGNRPDTQSQSINHPLGSILTGQNKKALITAIKKGEVDFDIKTRFLRPDELAAISTFPKDYFKPQGLKLSAKNQCKLIGNAVPPEWAAIIIRPVMLELAAVLELKAEKVA